MKATQVLVLVPSSVKTYANQSLKPGTAIVTPIDKGNNVDIIRAWYEEPGDISNVVTFEDRLTHAAGRLTESYPTSKMTGFNENEVVIAAVAQREEGNGWYISQIIEEEMLNAWAGEVIVEGGSAQFIRNRIAKGFTFPQGR